MITLFVHRSSILIIIYFYMMLIKIMFLIWYRQIQRVNIHQRLRYQMRFFGTMVNGILESIYCENGKICDEFDCSCGEEHEMYDDTYYMPDALYENHIDKYAYGSMNQQMI